MKRKQMWVERFEAFRRSHRMSHKEMCDLAEWIEENVRVNLTSGGKITYEANGPKCDPQHPICPSLLLLDLLFTPRRREKEDAAGILCFEVRKNAGPQEEGESDKKRGGLEDAEAYACGLASAMDRLLEEDVASARTEGPVSDNRGRLEGPNGGTTNNLTADWLRRQTAEQALPAIEELVSEIVTKTGLTKDWGRTHCQILARQIIEHYHPHWTDRRGKPIKAVQALVNRYVQNMYRDTVKEEQNDPGTSQGNPR